MAERSIAEGNIPAISHGKKWLNLSDSMRTTRKTLRFLRTIEYSRRAIGNLKKIKDGQYKTHTELIMMLAEALSAIFTLLFFVTDHRVFLAEVLHEKI
jgi:hypothetical protein